MLTVTSIAEVIRERTSVKNGYLDKEISEELVLSLLEDAVWAPTHGVREPWRFIFVPGEKKEAYIESVLQCHDKSRHEAVRDKHTIVPAFLAIVMREDPRQKQWEEDFAATSCMVQNFQLLAWEQDLGVVWKTPEHIRHPKFREALGVEPGEKVIGVLSIGYFNKEIAARKVRNRTNPAEKWDVFQ